MINIIGETAWHHEGNLDFFNQLIDELIEKSEIDYIKLHLLFDIDQYMSTEHPGYNTLKTWMIDKKEWEAICNKINASNKKLMLLVNDTKTVKFAAKFTPDIIEVHSVCLNDFYILNAINKHIHSKTKIVLGVGGSTIEEIENAIHQLNTDNIILMFGFQNYPTKYEDINFKKIRRLMSLFPNLEYGYADHTIWDHPYNIDITLMGAALGMNYIEKHITTQPGTERTDWSAAISIDQVNNLWEKIRILEQCEGNGDLSLSPAEKRYSVSGPMKKAPVLIKEVKANDTFSMEQISFKRTKETSDIFQHEITDFLGKHFKKDMNKDSIIIKNSFQTK